MEDKVEIFDISYDGAGVGKVGDKICFVPKTLPGEVVQAAVLNDSAKFCMCECQRILKESPARIKVTCPYFDLCGGCDFQHCAYEQEQKFKKQILAKELEKVGFLREIDFVPCEQRFYYRNKVKFEVKNAKIGYFKPKTHDFFEVKTCPICDERILQALPYVEEFLEANKLKCLKNVYIRVLSGEVAICFLFEKNAKIDIKTIQKTPIFDRFSHLARFWKVIKQNLCVSKEGTQKL